MRKSCAAGSAASSSARASASVRASGNIRRPNTVPARWISAFHWPLSRDAATWQVTICRSIGVAPVPVAACRVANSTMRAGEAPADGEPEAVTRDQMSVALPQIVRRDVAEQQRMEHALAGVVADVPREHRVGDLETGRLGREPRPEDQPVAPVLEVVRQRERLLGEARQPVADLAGQRGEQREPDGDVRHHGRSQRRIEPVDDAHGRLGHDHRAPDRHEQQHPLRVVLPRAAEGGAEEHPGETRDPGELRERDVGAAAGDGGDGVQEIDEVGPAAEGEELVHR